MTKKRTTRMRAASYRRLAWKALYAGDYRAQDRYNARAEQLYRQAEREDAFHKSMKEQQEKRQLRMKEARDEQRD